MKKLMSLLLALSMAFTITACGQRSAGAPAEDPAQGSTPAQDAAAPLPADDYPGKELRIIVPFQTGGALDVQTRLVAKYLGEELNTNVVVENVTGAAGTLGATQYLTEKPDSSVLLLMSAWLMTVHPLINQVEYTPEDYAPIIDHNCVDFVLFVRPDSGIETLEDLKAFAQEKGRILFTSDGVGGSTYIAQKTLYDQLGVPCETIATNGTTEGMTNLMAGTVDVAISAMNTAGDYVANGDIRPLVCFADEDMQDPIAGTIPCVKSQGIEEIYQGYYYYVARGGTDQSIIDKLHDAFAAVYANPDFIAEQEVIGFKAPGRDGSAITEYLTEFTDMAKSTFSLD